MRQKKTLEDFIQKSKEKYGEKFNYSLSVYDGLHNKITLICPNNHTFQTRPATHLSKKSKGGCKQCHFNNLPNILTKYNQETFIEACNKVHNNKYDYSKVLYISLKDNISIICKIHGEFIQKAVHHLLNKNGCTKCGRIITETSNKLSDIDIKNKLNKFRVIHKNKYDYGKIFRESGILWLELICQKHGSHITRFFNHEKGHGCPKCVSVRSNVQIEWLNYRTICDGFIQHSDNIGEFIIPKTKLCVDGYNKVTNTIYEFQGDFWHGNPEIYDLDSINKKINVTFRELYNKTLEKINILENMGYNVVYIWENDWTKAIKAVKKLQRKWRDIKSV